MPWQVLDHGDSGSERLATPGGTSGVISFTPLGTSRGAALGGEGVPHGEDDLASPTHQLGVTSAYATHSIAIRHAYGDSFRT